jgi:hypothetical protein
LFGGDGAPGSAVADEFIVSSGEHFGKGEKDAAIGFVIVPELATGDGAVMGFPLSQEMRIAVALRGDTAELDAAIKAETGYEPQKRAAHGL